MLYRVAEAAQLAERPATLGSEARNHACIAIIRAAVDGGVTFFDTAARHPEHLQKLVGR
jgi:aryl-alcohol dehydrogenase-like predicted oxidoreductase